RFAQIHGRSASFNKEAHDAFLKFAEAPDTPWRANFRDLNAAITRMATLAPRGRIRVEEVETEEERLRASWHRPDSTRSEETDLEDYFDTDALGDIDPFDRVQIAYMIAICKQSRSISEAGRRAFSASRRKKSNPNDSDRLRKFLAKWGLDFAVICPVKNRASP
ncbi:MAG: sigma 54-dependent transcriptional regulator, partial [Verrucomicrobiales bacterium]